MDSPPSTSTMAAAEPELTTTESSAAAAAAAAAQAAIQAMMVQITTDGVPKLHCPVCNKALISLNGYVRHLKKHEPPGGFFCRYCEDRFCSEDELKKHREDEHTTIACRICKDQGVTFTNEEDYREHIRIVHNGIDREIFKCEKCGAEYKTVEPFKRHQENQCGTIKPHQCDECEMAFYTKYNLKQHKIKHLGIRQFCCSYCGKNFLQKGRLVEHERSHTGEKPYKCDVCGKCFAHRESIVTHSSIHTGIKLVECRCCLSRFSCYSNLIKHRRARPDTCGLPEYNPPKNQVRTRRPRIPATLNPTSEIKVSNLNKIIKPAHKINEKKGRRTNKEIDGETDVAKPKPQRRKPGPRGKRKKPVSDSESEAVSTDNEDNTNDSSLLKEKNKRPARNKPKVSYNEEALAEATIKSKKATTPVSEVLTELKFERKPIWSDESDSTEDYPDFEKEFETESDDDKTEIKLPLPKISIKQEHEELSNDFEYTDATEYVNTELNVKSEDEQNIFNQKDKLLDCLLNDDEIDSARTLSCKLPTFDTVKVESLLDESEVVYIKDEDQEQVEDMLNCNELADGDLKSNCKIILEDVTHRYPKLKEATSIKISRKAKPLGPRSARKRRKKVETKTNKPTKPRKKYRKRGEPKEEDPKRTPKRMSKLSQSEVKERLRLLKKERSWQCPHCIKFYHIRKPFEKHLRDEHKLPEEELKQIFKDEGIGTLNDEVFRCEICSKIYLVEKRLIAHVLLHGDDGSLIHKCPCYCSLYFATKNEAQDHARQAHKDLLYCEICDKYMTGHDSLKNHRLIHHSGNKSPTQRINARNLVCDKCGRKYSSRTSLTDHVRSDCGRKPLYPCNICGKHLTTAGILKTHLLLHKDDTPYQCDQCGKTFKVKAQYKSHLKTRHTNYKPFKCHLCPKEYPYRESLLTHMTVHTGIKRFLCNGCGKRFTCISNLQAHRKVHASTCGSMPLNAKATQYMGVQKGNLLLGAKPEAGIDYKETNTLIAREVIDCDQPMAQELNYPSEPSAPLATQPLNYHQPPPHLMLPHLMLPHFIDDAHSSY